MKNLTIIILILLPFTRVYSQTAYKGGKGIGYDMAEISNLVIGESNPKQQLLIFPNPATAEGMVEIANFDSLESNSSISLLGSNGNLLFTYPISVNDQVFQLKAPKVAGVYYVTLKNSFGQRIGKLLVMEK